MILFNDRLLERCQELGFSAVGVAPASPSGMAGPYGPDSADTRRKAQVNFESWVSAGKAGDMAWLGKHSPFKFAPDTLIPGTKSVIVVAIDYRQKPVETPEGNGTIARFAWGRDYHKTLALKLKRLVETLTEEHPGQNFKPWVDAHPLHERYFAQVAGIGFTGRHTLTIAPGTGSWILLGVILSSADFAPGPVLLNPKTPAHVNAACPPGCRRCTDACPTKALDGSGGIDASRCISYLTIESKGTINPEFHKAIGNRVFGCDECQNACPFNKGRGVTLELDFLKYNAGPSLPIASLLDIANDVSLQKRFAGSPLVRAGRVGLVRNACVVAGNLKPDNPIIAHLLPKLRTLAESDTSDLVREQAVWAIQQIETR